MSDEKTVGFLPGTDLDDITDSQVYAKWVKEGSWYGAHGRKDYFEHSYLFSGLSGEAGEASDEWKKIQRSMEFLSTTVSALGRQGMISGYDPYKFDIALAERVVKLVDEVGDVLWYIQALCNMWDISIEDLMIFNAAKLHMKHQHDARMPPWPKHFASAEGARVAVILAISKTLSLKGTSHE